MRITFVESNLISLPARWPFDHAVVFLFASGAKTSRNDHLLELALYVIHHSLSSIPAFMAHETIVRTPLSPLNSK